ncbi:MAG: hypothetical protein FMLXV2_gp1 [Fushun monolepta lauta xinmovirus 2]|uniref:Uncharacterized protein n=1 Tax=Fushun monolepta lauta xinmovirus 2 TaxID=2905555 RepID=A0A8K1XY21_9MONO|nr:MAG: hypothetical protein FMLXV2_gp1 [Fushun monolepta lauta xinmovirus 2]
MKMEIIDDEKFVACLQDIETTDKYTMIQTKELQVLVQMTIVITANSKTTTVKVPATIKRVKSKDRSKIYIQTDNHKKFIGGIVRVCRVFKATPKEALLRQYCQGELQDAAQRLNEINPVIEFKDQTCPVIGPSSKEATIYSICNIGRIPKLTKVGKPISLRKKNSLISFYLNCAISVMPTEVFIDEPWDLTKELARLFVDGHLAPFLPEEEDYTKYHDRATPELHAKILVIGAITLMVASKNVGINDIKTDSAQNIGEWMRRRIPPLLTKLNMSTSLADMIPKVEVDLLYVAHYLSETIQVRKPLLFPVISKGEPVDEDSIFGGIRQYAQMILSYTGMQAIQIGYQFALAAETYAHTIIEVVRQSKELESQYRKYRALCGEKDYSFEFLWLMEGTKNDLQARKYGDLLYCAMYCKKLRSKGSWDNFNLSIDTQTDKSRLGAMCCVKFNITQDSTLEDEVNDYLASRGRKRTDKDICEQPPANPLPKLI